MRYSMRLETTSQGKTSTERDTAALSLVSRTCPINSVMTIITVIMLT